MHHAVESVGPILSLLVVVASLSAAGTLLTRFSGPSTDLAMPAAGGSGLGFGPIAVAVIVAAVGAIPVLALLLAAPTRSVY